MKLQWCCYPGVQSYVIVCAFKHYQRVRYVSVLEWSRMNSQRTYLTHLIQGLEKQLRRDLAENGVGTQ